MPSQGGFEPSQLAGRLVSWLRTREPGVTDVTVTDIDTPASNGFSSETVMFTASWKRDGSLERHRLVLRTKPTGHTVFPEYDMAMQYSLMRTVGALTSVKVPPLRYLETDVEAIGSEFFVMDRVSGLVPPDNLPYTMDGWLLEATAEQQRALQNSTLDVLVELHGVDIAAIDVPGLELSTYGERGLDQMLGYYDHFLEWGREGSEQPVLERARDWLMANRPDPEPPAVLLWGDSRIGNVMYQNFEPVAVFDWEMAGIGPRELDLSWYCLFMRFFSEFLGVEELRGFAPQAEVVERYEELTGYEVADFEWYTIFGAYKYAAIMMRIILGESITGGGMFTLEDNVAISMLEQLLEAHA